MKRFLSVIIVILGLSASRELITLADDAKKPTTAPATSPVVNVQPDGSLLLKADGARIHGFKLHLVQKPEPTLIFWVKDEEYPEWPRAVKKGNYAVEITYSCAPRSGGQFAVTAAANKVQGKTEETADWHTFKTVKVGNLTVLNDDTNIALVPVGHIERALMNVRAIKLTPIPDPTKDQKK